MPSPLPNITIATESIREEISRRRLQMQRLHSAQQCSKMQTTSALSPFAASILGLEATLPPAAVTQQAERNEAAHETVTPRPTVNVPTTPASRSSRSSRRPQSHYNTFQTVCTPATDEPPTYATAVRQKSVANQDIQHHRDILPSYTCTVSAEAKLLLNLESVSPLHTVSQGEWRDVYVVLRGTVLNVHRVKDGGQGKLFRSYTLQHAEIGLATDSSHTVLVPQSRLAHFIPSAARHKAYKKDPQMFRQAPQTILRLRMENEQLQLADSCEERIHDFIGAISAGIDIALPIDERSVPKQWTVPRRRRRPRPAFNGDITDTNAIAEQERILQQMYPAFAERPTNQPAQDNSTTSAPQASSQIPATPTREDDDIDLSAMREDSDNSATILTPSTTTTSTTTSPSFRPAVSRTTTASTVNSTFNDEMVYETAPANFTPEGKWCPPHTRTTIQIQRYTRRCIPILTADAPRASDVLICNGKRVKVNWRMELLEQWALQPPSYKSHGFEKSNATTSTNALERSASNASSSRVSDHATPTSSQSELAAHADEILSVEPGLPTLELSRTETASAEADKKRHRSSRTSTMQTPPKGREARRGDVVADMHGVVFCF